MAVQFFTGSYRRNWTQQENSDSFQHRSEEYVSRAGQKASAPLSIVSFSLNTLIHLEDVPEIILHVFPSIGSIILSQVTYLSTILKKEIEIFRVCHVEHHKKEQMSCSQLTTKAAGVTILQAQQSL